MKNSASHESTGYREAPTGTLRARPSGLRGSALVLEGGRGSLGILGLTSPGEILLEDLAGRAEKTTSGYRLELGEVEADATRARGVYRLRSGGHVYEANLNPLRDYAKAHSADGGRIAVKGGLLSRSYDVFYGDAGDGAFEGSVLLLYMTATLRRKAFTV